MQLQSGSSFHVFFLNLWLFDDKKVDVLFYVLSKSDMKYPMYHTTVKKISIQKNLLIKDLGTCLCGGSGDPGLMWKSEVGIKSKQV